MTKTTSTKSRQPRKTIAQKNAEFDALPKSEQRVAIARDIIAQVKAERYQAQTGTYFSLRPGEDDPLLYGDVVGTLELQSLINQQGAKCTVCGLGACFASAVRLADNLKVEDEHVSIMDWCAQPELEVETIEYQNGQKSFDQKLKKYFGHVQLGLIECAFERSTDFRRQSSGEWAENKSANVIKAAEFGECYEISDDRLIAICENLIENGGIFRP